MASAIVQDLKEHILERSLGVFYPDNYDFKPCIKRVEKLRKDFPQITGELADGLAVLTLYDLAILIDDSASMRTEENGDRIKTLAQVLRMISRIYCPTQEGEEIMSVRFLNSSKNDKCPATQLQMNDILKNHTYQGPTKIGTQLKAKILKPLVTKDMTRPLIVICITDGYVEGDSPDCLQKAILDCVGRLPSDRKTSVSFQFSRVGNDKRAVQLLKELRHHDGLEGLIDCQPADINFYPETDHEINADFICKVSKLMLGSLMEIWNVSIEDTYTGGEEWTVDANRG